MTALHPTADELELYVTDMLAGHRASEIEDHVIECERCAGALAAEARLEVALEQVAAFRADKSIAPLRRVKSIFAATLVAAAALVIVFAGEAFTNNQPQIDPTPVVVAPPAADAGATTLANNDSGTL